MALLAAVMLLAALTPTASAAAPDPCPGDAITPDRVITGEFGKDLMRSYVFVPFEVPAGTTAVRIKYCYDQPDAPTSSQVKNVLDLGLYEPRADGAGPWGPEEFRGWGGSSHPDVTVSPRGFSTEQQYLANPKGDVPGMTTRGFHPGPIPAGEWAAELGVAAVASQEEGDADGKVAWRVELDFSDAPVDTAYTPAPYRTKPARSKPGWYAGDMHVHAEHSSLGDATMTEAFDYAFRDAGLDFITLTDYISGSSWGEVGRYQGRYPGKLIVRSAEIITYRGHTNSQANTTFMDYRTGPLYERADDGTLTKVRGETPPSRIFGAVHDAGGFTQINHPRIFPSSNPLFQYLCRGCPWDYSDSQTDYTRVDAWEVATGPPGTSDPPRASQFTVDAIKAWDALRAAGHRVTAVASSDSHNAGRTPGGITQAPIGVGTTVVYADELSEDGLERAIRLGHAYVKIWGPEYPDLRLTAVASDGTKAIMGDALRSSRATFTAHVLGGVRDGAERRLVILRDGRRVASKTVKGNDFKLRFHGRRAGDYRLQLERGEAIDGLTNPITLGTSPLAIKASVRPARARAGKRTRFVFDVRLRAQDREVPLAGALVSFAGKRVRTDVAGHARISARISSPGRYRAVVTKQGLKRVRLTVTVKRAG